MTTRKQFCFVYFMVRQSKFAEIEHFTFCFYLLKAPLALSGALKMKLLLTDNIPLLSYRVLLNYL